MSIFHPEKDYHSHSYRKKSIDKNNRYNSNNTLMHLQITHNYFDIIAQHSHQNMYWNC